jgi:hypothetical protein
MFNALPYRRWFANNLCSVDPTISDESFQLAFGEVTHNPSVHIYFIMDDVVQHVSLQPVVAFKSPQITEWELRQVLSVREILWRTTFYHHGQLLDGATLMNPDLNQEQRDDRVRKLRAVFDEVFSDQRINTQLRERFWSLIRTGHVPG